MKKLQLLVFVLSLLFSLEGSGQSWFSTCGEHGIIKKEQQDSVTHLWVEGGFWNCYGIVDSTWLEWRIFCKADMSVSEVYEVGEFDTLRLLLPKNSQTVILCRKMYKRNDWKWGQSTPNVCLFGGNDITCFRQPSVNVTAVDEQPSYTIQGGCITTTEEALIVQWPMLEPTKILVGTILKDNMYCLDKDMCFYLMYQSGFSTNQICID